MSKQGTTAQAKNHNRIYYISNAQKLKCVRERQCKRENK